MIRETVLTGIRKASQRLNYTNSIPSIAFPCSGHKDTPLHPATLSEDEKLLICSTHPAKVCSEVTEWHKVWMGKRLLKDGSDKGEKMVMDHAIHVQWIFLGSHQYAHPSHIIPSPVLPNASMQKWGHIIESFIIIG